MDKNFPVSVNETGNPFSAGESSNSGRRKNQSFPVRHLDSIAAAYIVESKRKSLSDDFIICPQNREKKMLPLFGTAVHEYYLDLIRKNFTARKKRIEALQTREDAERYINDIRKKIASLFPLPTEKTPLNVCETGTLDFPTFVLHKIIYCSRPNYPVTANLFLPKTKEKVPAVLFLCGHSANGKAETFYQIAQRSLAMKGYAVLAIDPVSQGERLQMLDVPEFHGNCCEEHNTVGKQILLAGETMSAWRAWDAIRGLDYLLSRPEVDTTRVGLTGNSGGGTMTTFVNALEDRLTMAAPSCYITTWLHNVENELPADSEQLPPGTIAAGLEMADFLIARAPRPVVILGQKNDFFDPRGTREAYEEVRRIYQLFGAENAIRLLIGNGSHGFSRDNREGMYSLFNDTAKLNVPAAEPDDVPVSAEQDIYAAPGGQVRNLPNNKYVREIVAEKASGLIAARKAHTKQDLCEIMRGHLKLDTPFIPYYRVLRIRKDDRNFYSRFGLETEPDGRLMCVLKLKSANETFYHLPRAEKIILYIPHLDAQDELSSLSFPDDTTVYGLDIRGIGECTPSGCDQPKIRNFFHEYQCDYHYASLGLMSGKPILGGRVKDILCAVELLAQNQTEIEIQAKGQGTIPALIAALLSDKISALKLTDAPDSWESMLRKPIPGYSLSVMIPNILAETDLPELREAITEKLR